MAKYDVGDIVKLKSGGPKMTIRGKHEHSGQFFCQWFAGSKLSDGLFPPESLVRVKEEKDEKG